MSPPPRKSDAVGDNRNPVPEDQGASPLVLLIGVALFWIGGYPRRA